MEMPETIWAAGYRHPENDTFLTDEGLWNTIQDGEGNETSYTRTDLVEARIREAVEAMQDRCAKIALTVAAGVGVGDDPYTEGADEASAIIADAIRNINTGETR